MFGIPFPWKTKTAGRPIASAGACLNARCTSVQFSSDAILIHRGSAGTVRGFPACISYSKRRPTMPMFHFNSLTGDLFLPDPEGEELPNVNTAREVAERSAREALIEAVKTGDTAPDCIQVTDSEGREVAIVFIEDLLDG
jgi:hypothetical protein